MEISYGSEPLGFKRIMYMIVIVVILMAIPVFGWLILIGLSVRPRAIGGIPVPIGFIYKRCPRCGHLLEDAEFKLDEYREWNNFICVKCGQHSRILNLLLLGVYRNEQWTGGMEEPEGSRR